MINGPYLTSILGLLLVVLYFGSFGLNDTNVFGSISDDVDDAVVEQPAQQTLLNNGTSGAAEGVYDTHEFNVGSRAQNLFILIPNEGHHGPGEEDEARYLNQPFVPESVTINPGTNVVWFNGDVGHEHNIAISGEGGSSSSGSDSTIPLYQTGEFSEFDARNYTFNEMGDFSYADTVEYENGFIMRGNITVTDDSTSQQGTTGSIPQTIGLLMVPTEDLAQHTQDLQTKGFVIDSTHNFSDLREGDEQTLVVWEAPENSDVSTIITDLAEVSQQFPYS
jgi:plastocyanin